MSYANHTPQTTESTSEETDLDATSTDDDPATDRRDVVVPPRVYKAVTVFSTLFAVLTIVAGFLTLDVATDRGSAELSAVDPIVALAGLGAIAAGAVVYAFSTRFRTDGMGPDGGETDG